MRAAHLSGPAAFKAVLAESPVAKTEHFVLHVLRDPKLGPKDAALAVGALAPKRQAKRAVTRNAVKRQIYEWFEGWRASMPGSTAMWCVVRLRAGLVTAASKPSPTKASPGKPQVRPSASTPAMKQMLRAELDALGQKAAKRLLPAQTALAEV